VLAEVFSNEGIGTLIYANEYQQIRRALKKDVRHLLMLTKESVASEELVKRPVRRLKRNVGDYYLFEIDKNPVACVALHVYPEQGKGELAFLYVRPSHENQGIGRKLIQFVENKARESGLQELITLSTRPLPIFNPKADLWKERLMTCHLAVARSMTKAAGIRRCSSKSSNEPESTK